MGGSIGAAIGASFSQIFCKMNKENSAFSSIVSAGERAAKEDKRRAGSDEADRQRHGQRDKKIVGGERSSSARLLDECEGKKSCALELHEEEEEGRAQEGRRQASRQEAGKMRTSKEKLKDKGQNEHGHGWRGWWG